MGLFNKKQTEEAPVTKKVVNEGTIIGEGIEFVGTFQTEEQIDIRGTVNGHISSPVEVIVSKTGLHKGTMDVEYLTVDGALDSDIYCRNTITLRDDCNAKGKLTTPKLDANHGSNFDGELVLQKSLEEENAQKKAAEQEMMASVEDPDMFRGIAKDEEPKKVLSQEEEDMFKGYSD